MKTSKSNFIKTNPFSLRILFLIPLLAFSACASQPQECVCVCDCPSEETAGEQTAADTAESENSEAVIPEETAEETGGFVPCPIAFDSDRDGNLEIYTMDSNGENLVNLTNDPADDWNPDWSPDGSQIAFTSDRETEDGGGQFIYVMNADGSNVFQLTTLSPSDYADWSPDGGAIIFSSDATGNHEIYIMKADGSNEPTNFTNSDAQDIQPTWSPDGSQIAWLSGEEDHWDLFVMNADGSDVLQLTDNGGVYDMTWTIDGQLFTHWDNGQYGCFNCVMNADGSNVTDAGGKGEIQRYLPYWTLEGDRVELVSADMGEGNDEIYLVGEIYPDVLFNLTNNPGNDRNPDWAALCGPN